MFNYYSYQKKKEEYLKERKQKLNDIKNNKKNKIKRELLAENYEQRVKQFIYNISDNPHYLSKKYNLFLSPRDINKSNIDIDTNSHIIHRKKFGFNSFETDRMKAEKYDKAQKQLKQLLEKNFPINKKILTEKLVNHSLSHKEIKNNDNKIINKYDRLNNEEEFNKMIQPRLRFKPRNEIAFKQIQIG